MVPCSALLDNAHGVKVQRLVLDTRISKYVMHLMMLVNAVQCTMLSRKRMCCVHKRLTILVRRSLG